MTDATTALPTGGTAATDLEVERFLELIEHDRPETAIDIALDRIHQGESATSIVERLLAPAQRQVGQRWHDGRYTVAHEHVATGVVDDALGLLSSHTPRPDPEHTIALLCAEGEWHTTPARMAALCFRDAGWRVQFLGGSLPPEHLTASLGHVAPQAVAVSCTLPLALAGVPALIEACHDHELPTIAGGIGFGPDDLRARHLGADGHALDITTAAELLTDWLDQPPTTPTRPSRPVVDAERATLTVDRSEVVDATYRRLERRLPAMAKYDDRQRRHTRQDLGHILQFVGVTLLVDDHRVFSDFTTWLQELLEARGLPDTVLRASLDTVASALPAGLSHAHAVIEHGLSMLEAGPRPQRETVSGR